MLNNPLECFYVCLFGWFHLNIICTSVLFTLLVGDLLHPVVLDLVLPGVVGLMLPLL